MVEELTFAERRVLKYLAKNGEAHQATLRASMNTLQSLYFRGLIRGWMYKFGADPTDRWQDITDKGRAALIPSSHEGE
jgi:hypothetical protein